MGGSIMTLQCNSCCGMLGGSMRYCLINNLVLIVKCWGINPHAHACASGKKQNRFCLSQQETETKTKTMTLKDNRLWIPIVSVNKIDEIKQKRERKLVYIHSSRDCII